MGRDALQKETKPTKYIQDMTREEIEFQLAEADFQFGGWFSTKERLKRENAALESQVRDLTGERERERQALGNLLAVIHRDGGHYQAEHGSKKAAEDAETLVCWLRDNVERLREGMREIDKAKALLSANT